MSETMVERVARAISADMERGFPPRVQSSWETLSDQARETMMLRARAAIAAMREPTEAVLNAGADHMHEAIDYSMEPGEGIDGYYVTPVWQAMIDQALAEEGE